MDGKLPVVVEVAEVATVKASEVKEVRSNTSWPTPDPTWCRPWGSWPILPIVALPLTTDELLAAALLLSARVADLERTLLEAAAAAAAAEAASQAGQGRLVLLNRELVSAELELLLSLVPVELVPNLFLL